MRIGVLTRSRKETTAMWTGSSRAPRDSYTVPSKVSRRCRVELSPKSALQRNMNSPKVFHCAVSVMIGSQVRSVVEGLYTIPTTNGLLTAPSGGNCLQGRVQDGRTYLDIWSRPIAALHVSPNSAKNLSGPHTESHALALALASNSACVGLTAVDVAFYRPRAYLAHLAMPLSAPAPAQNSNTSPQNVKQ